MLTKPGERTIVGCLRLAISYPSSTVAAFTADVSGNLRHPKPAPQASDHIALLARRSSAHRSGSQDAASFNPASNRSRAELASRSVTRDLFEPSMIPGHRDHPFQSIVITVSRGS